MITTRQDSTSYGIRAKIFDQLPNSKFESSAFIVVETKASTKEESKKNIRDLLELTKFECDRLLNDINNL